MNIVKKLTLRHLQANKGRTIVTVLGICVSVAMITAVFVGMASFLNLSGELELYSDGNQHAYFSGITDKEYKKLLKQQELSMVGCYSLEHEMSFCLDERPSDRVGVGDVYQGDETNLKQMVTCKYEGVLPKNAGELAVEESLIEKNHLDWKLGDQVTIPLGNRYLLVDGNKQAIMGNYQGGEKFEKTREQSFVITAILHDNRPTNSKGKLVCGMSEEEREEYFGATITLKNPNYKSLEVINTIIKRCKLKEVSVNSEYGYDYGVSTFYLSTVFAISKDSNIAKSLLPLVLGMLILIMIASVMLVYNAFNMSLSERVRYLGMLASVGATRRQKKTSVYFEGALLGLIGIPVGILAGIFGISITLKVVERKLIEGGMIVGMGADTGVQLSTIVPFWSIVGIVLVSAITIYLSAVIPARKASKITPIDAIRQNTELKVKARQLSTPRYIRLLFGYEGELAHKSLKRNRRKTRTITVSLILSVVLFLTVNYFSRLFMQANEMQQEMPYQVQVIINNSQKESFLEKLDDIGDIDAYYGVANMYQEFGKKTKDGVTKSKLMDSDNMTRQYKNIFDSAINVFVNRIDDADFDKLIKENGGNPKDYYGETLKGVVMNNISHQERGAKVFTDKLLGKAIDIPIDGEDKIELEPIDFVEYDKDNYICNLNHRNSISIFVPNSVAYNVTKKQLGISDDEAYYMCGIETKEHEKVLEQVQAIMEENNYESAYAQDYVESLKSMSTVIFVISLLINGFVALITLITVANIINTISTGIALRKREFAMLKSVGTTQGGFTKMICLESVFYGLKALIFGIPLSLLSSYWLYDINDAHSIPFEPSVGIYLLVMITVFMIIGLSMGYSIHKLKGDSIVETLKQEII